MPSREKINPFRNYIYNNLFIGFDVKNRLLKFWNDVWKNPVYISVIVLLVVGRLAKFY